MGGISNSALKFTNLLYAKGSGARKRRWDSDGMRVALKKQFLDLLSSVLCHHRVLDFIFLGTLHVNRLIKIYIDEFEKTAHISRAID